MAEFEEKLNSILSDPAAMGQIAALAQALSTPQTEPQNQKDSSTPPDAVPGQAAPPAGADSDLSALLGGLGDLDPKLIQTALGLLSAYGTDDDRRVALLTALKPFLKPERWAKVDRAIQIARLTRVIRVALQLFKKDSGEEAGHV